MKVFYFTLILFFTMNISYAQSFYENGRDHLYQAVVSITPDDYSTVGPGYVVSATTKNSNSTRGEVLRLDFDGNVIWNIAIIHNALDESQVSCKITHIEKYSEYGELKYLVVGTMDYGNHSTLITAVINDNGDILQNREFKSNSNVNLTGIKGIYSGMNHEFVIVGIDSDGFGISNDKSVLVMGLDVMSLAVIWQFELSTANITYDYDMVSDIIELPGSEYFITGTSNTTNAANVTTEALMCAKINSAGVIWDKNFVTMNNSWDAGSAALYNADANSVYVLGNNGLNHAYHITEIDVITSSVIKKVYSHDTYNSFDKFGFDIRFSKLNPTYLVISGYEFKYLASGGANYNTYAFVSTLDNNLIHQSTRSYMATNSSGGTSGIYNYADNQMLYLTPHELPYYYNNMIDYRFDDDGYVFIGNSNVPGNGNYSKKLWTTSINGWSNSDPVCDVLGTEMTINPGNRNFTTSLADVNQSVGETGNIVKKYDISMAFTQCSPLLKTNMPTNITEKQLLEVSVYPNPASDIISIAGIKSGSIYSVYNVLGNVVLRGKIQSLNSDIDISILSEGSYFIVVKSTGEVTSRERFQKIK
jgi:hypothetical protein